MANPSSAEPANKRDWVLTSKAFHNLLNWLDGDLDSGGQRYLEIRRRLVLYFNRKNCLTPDELADETLNRVSRRLEEEGEITGDSPAQYCYIVARYVLLEFLRQRKRQQTLLDADLPAPTHSTEDQGLLEKRLEFLNHCMQKLSTNDRDLIVRYYQGERRTKIENRKRLAEKLGMTLNALSIRACRLRSKLEECVKKRIGWRK